MEEELPEKYRGKSAKEIAKMHMEAERLIGRQGSEVGELRKLVDDYIHTQATTKQQLRTESTEEIDFFADPKKAVENAIENHPKIREAEALTLEMQRAKALNALQTTHPDYQQVVTDPGFQQWVMASKVTPFPVSKTAFPVYKVSPINLLNIDPFISILGASDIDTDSSLIANVSISCSEVCC